MKRVYHFLIAGIISLIVLVSQFVWSRNLPYSLTGLRMATTEQNGFLVTWSSSLGPAYESGIRPGDHIIRINNLNTKQFIDSYAWGSDENVFLFYSKIWKADADYEVELSDGRICCFRIDSHAGIIQKIGAIDRDNIILFLTALIFIVIGFVSSIYAADGTIDFIWFMFSGGLCIANCYTEAANPLAYTNFNFVVFDAMTSIACLSIFRQLACFFKSMKKESFSMYLRKLSWTPCILSLIKYVLVLSGTSSLYDTFLMFVSTGCLGITFMILIVSFIVLLKKTPRQSSIVLRFFFMGVCFATIPAAVIIVLKVAAGNYWITSSNETLYLVLPLLFIPLSVFYAMLQTSGVNLDSICSDLMTGGCASTVLILLSMFVGGTDMYIIGLISLSPLLFIFLKAPVASFLFPRVEYAQRKLDDLERKVFNCRDTKDVLQESALWISEMLDTGYVVFYGFEGNDPRNGKVVYRQGKNDRQISESLASMLEERIAHTVIDQEYIVKNIMVHRGYGFSVPYYKSHELKGFIFVGTGSWVPYFSSSEMKLIPPVARIIMESSMVIELKQQTNNVSAIKNNIVYSFADMIESRDGTTGQHVKRTSQIVDRIVTELLMHNVYGDEVSPLEYEMIILAAPLHDIGKIKVPDSILSKPGRLTDEEFEIIKTHPVEGEKILRKTMDKIEDEQYLRIARDMALYHHEKWNGTGYPKGLAGHDIPVCARIMAIADVFDALCSSRSYKEAYSIDRAFGILEESRGEHFEPCLVDVMYSIRGVLEQIYRN